MKVKITVCIIYPAFLRVFAAGLATQMHCRKPLVGVEERTRCARHEILKNIYAAFEKRDDGDADVSYHQSL